MGLVGASFAGRTASDEPDFKTLLTDAAGLLRGDGLDKVDAEALRETLAREFRWILVDEYQDVGPEECALNAAVAGRCISDPHQRVSLFGTIALNLADRSAPARCHSVMQPPRTGWR